MGDWMGSCVDVKLGEEMGHFGHPIPSANLTSRSLFFIFFIFLTHVKEGLPHYFLTMWDTWHTVDPSDLFVME